jgi:hypothetical protein
MRLIIAIQRGTQRCQDGARDAANNNARCAHSASSNIVFGFSDVRRLLSVGNILHLLFLGEVEILSNHNPGCRDASCLTSHVWYYSTRPRAYVSSSITSQSKQPLDCMFAIVSSTYT